ncbi:cobalamin-binding protein [Marinobacter orientalis]|uniref:Cobalamin-binding protein n=1 Tax=Marinobacter orientalis TaxID=1928859 RepID=A0A7Y0RCA3_9GAMM|nr:cobalamin-binding protein [Marinobacter orientalis]NMT63586.1 cobalamin-binding protein [Marinobacter orientalis]TGX48640.1 cobalamin-binding protein [Marinobacter orientalis]
MKHFGLIFVVTLVVCFPLPGLADDLCATDGLDHKVCLTAPAERVVSLSPGATELLFSAGAGDKLVAVSAWSDYPPEAAKLPQAGNSNRLDLEAIVALEPDLVVAWVDGNSASQLAKIEALGVPVFWLKPRTFEDIASAVERLGVLSGNEKTGAGRAADFLAGIEQLRDRYQEALPVRVFYQVWHEPLMTINDEELIGRAIRLCGGSNVFGHLPRVVPRISKEAVLEANPDAILSGGEDSDDRRWLEQWRQYPELAAVAMDNLYLIEPSLIQRSTLRMLEGTSQLCRTLEEARARL